MTSVMHDAVPHEGAPDDPATGPGPGGGARRARAPLSATSSILAFGHLSWLAWVWLGAAVFFAGTLVVMNVLDEDPTTRLWQGIGAGWQRWVILAAGCSSPWSFFGPFVANGISRRQFSTSTMVAMVAVCGIGAVYAVVGFVAEGPIYDAMGWNVDGGVLGATSPLLLVAIYFVTYAVYFAAGWLIGVVFYRVNVFTAILLIVPCSIPVAVVEVLVSRTTDITFFPGTLTEASHAVTLPAAALAVVATLAVARRTTAGAAVRTP